MAFVAFLVISVCLLPFGTEASRPSQFMTITASPAPAPAISGISLPPEGLAPAFAPTPFVDDITPELAPVSSPVSSPDVSPAPALESNTLYSLYGSSETENSFSDDFNSNDNSGYKYNVPEKQGMSDNRFAEVTPENSVNENFNNNNGDNRGYSESNFDKQEGSSQGHFDEHYGYNVPEKQGMSDNRFAEVTSENSVNENFNNNYNDDNRGYSESHFEKQDSFSQGHFDEHYGYNVPEKQGMSDTRFMEDGKYSYNANNENSYYNNNNNGYNIPERQGMSDTRFMENGRYYHDISNDNYRQNQGSEGYDDNFKNEFDSMEEYDRRHGYPATQTWEDQP